MGRPGQPEDCVGAYLFLASDTLSGFITGATIDVNGGVPELRTACDARVKLHR